MKKFKKLLMFLFVFGLIVFADSITASAVDITEGDNIIPGSGTWANFTWTVDGEGTLTISGQGTMDTNESQEWSAYKHVIEKVVIGEGITNIKDSLFEDYKYLKTVEFPASLIYTGAETFRGCSSLEEVVVKEGLTNIGSRAFYGCKNLKDFTFPETMNCIQTGAFVGTGLTKVHLSKNVVDLYADAFDYYNLDQFLIAEDNTTLKLVDNAIYTTKLYIKSALTGDVKLISYIGDSTETTYTMPDNCKLISQNAFTNTKYLKKVIIPGSVTKIENNTFANNFALEEIVFEGDAPTFYENAFAGVLAIVYYPADNLTWTDAVKQQYGGSVIWKASDDTSDTRPESATGIVNSKVTWELTEDGTLTVRGTGPITDENDNGYYSDNDIPWNSYKNRIKNVVIEDGITTVGTMTFQNCRVLESVTLADSVEIIRNQAFNECEQLTEIKLSSSLKEIWNYAFGNCTSLKVIELPQTLTAINSYAFYGAGLTEVIVPVNVQTMHIYAFADCKDLQKIQFTGNAPSIEDTAFKNVTATVYYPADNATWTEETKKQYGGTLTWSDQIPESIEAGSCGENVNWELMGDYTLVISGTGRMGVWSPNQAPWQEYESVIQKVVIEEGVTNVGENAFLNHTALTTVDMADSVTQIGSGAFMDCKALKAFELSDNLVDILSMAFYNCESFTNVDFPETLREIGAEAFYKTGVTVIQLPAATVRLEDRALVTDAKLGMIFVAEDNPVFKAVDYVLYSKDETVLHAYPVKKSGEIFCVPQSVETIKPLAFSCNTELKELVFTGNAPVFAEDCFYGTTLTVYYPEGDTSWTEEIMQQYGGNVTWKAGEALGGGEVDETFSWSLSADGTLTLSGTAEMPEWTSTSEIPWSPYISAINKVVIEEGITSVSNGAFSGMTNLTAVQMADSVLSIGVEAFAGTGLTGEVIISDNLEMVGPYAFAGCKKMTKVEFPETLTYIGFGAFSNTGLTEVYIPAATIYYDGVPFAESKLERITVAEGNPLLYAENNVVFTKENKELFIYPPCRAGSTYAVPEGTKGILYGAFIGSQNLKSVTLPTTLESVQDEIFAVCPNLERVRFKGNTPVFTENTFAGLTATVLYPSDDATWTEEVRGSYGGVITWVPYESAECSEHTVDSWSVMEATCTTDGEEVGFCTVCSAEIVKVIPATGHDYNEYYTVDIPATADASGLESRHCKNCDATKDSRVIPKLESVYNDVNSLIQNKEAESLTEEDKAAVKEQVAALVTESKNAEEVGENLDSSAVAVLEKLYVESDDSVVETKVDSSVSSTNVIVEGAALTVESYKPEVTDENKDEKYQAVITITEPETTGDSELDSKVENNEAIVFDISMAIVNEATGEAVSEEAKDVQPIAPIKFTIPVPEGMEEGFVLYHHKDTGEVETVPYEIVEMNGTLYIEFVATSFSFYSFVKDEHTHDWQQVPGEFADATCTADGYVVMKCSVKNCGKVMTKKTEAATGHNYIDYVCENCGHKIPSEELKISTASLTLYDNLTVNFKAKKHLFTDVGYSNPFMAFTFDGKQTIVADGYESGDYYVFDFSNIRPDMMNDLISATLYAEFEGTRYVSKTINYGVISYCNNMLGKFTGEEYAELRTLLVDLLNYGAQSQIYTGYNTNALVNANLTEEQKACGTSVDREYVTVQDIAFKTIENPAVTWKSAGLNLKDRVEIRLKLAADSIDSLVVRAELDDGTQWDMPASWFEATDGGYYVYFNALNAGQMSEPVYFTVYDGDTAVSNTLRYSVESYAQSTVKKAETNADYQELAALLKTMMKYGDAAYNYVN